MPSFEVVAAYSCMNVWLNAAPALAEIESCLSTVAQSIELGVTGGKEMVGKAGEGHLVIVKNGSQHFKRMESIVRTVGFLKFWKRIFVFLKILKAPDQYKPASQRVRDAAEMLLHSLFTEVNEKVEKE